MTSEESLVINALSVDEAIILGLTRLAATRDEVEIEILDEGSRGFLGIGVREARVRLTRRPPVVELPVAKEPEPAPAVAREPEPATPVEVTAAAVGAPVAVKPVAEMAVEPAEEPADKPAEEPAVQPADEPAVQPADGPVSGAPPAPRKPRRERRERSHELHESREPRETRESGPEVAGDLDREMIERTAVDVAEHLFPEMNIQVATNWQREDRPTLWISLRGKDADVLVGPRAQTLDSVQYLFRTLLHRLADGNYNVVVDADGYRRRRRRSLESQARKMADQAVKTGRTLRMRPMPAHERRVVHIILRKDKRVKTESTGRGRDRAITIVPVDAEE